MSAVPVPICGAAQVTRMQVWGGNCNVQRRVETQGLTGWIFCHAFPPASCGGDVYYLSACSEENLFRIVLADVSGHGGEFGAAAETLAKYIADHINVHDQSELMRDLNADILRAQGKYATAVVLSYQKSSGSLLFTNAGHPPILWYRAAANGWEMLHDETPHAVAHEGLPIGLIADTDYSQTAVQLGEGDILVLYTDGFAEACDPVGNELGYDGLLKLVSQIPANPPELLGQRLIDALDGFCGRTDYDDDRSLLVLQRGSS
jgi:sigma-B regulation protein RsbU (phosphoserine phosphatase)